MSKKKNKKSKYFSEYTLSGKKGKGNKKDLKKATKKLKTVQPTLSKKDGKAMKKFVTRPVKVEKEFLKQRGKCNHADGVMSVQEFLDMSPTASAYTPMLNRLIDVFGEEHVHICARCFEAVVDRDEISTTSVNEALAVLYAACGVVTANVRMKDDEVKDVNKLKGLLEEFAPVVEFMGELEEKGSRNASATAADADLNAAGMEID